MLIFAPDGLENSYAYQKLSSYGTPNISQVVENTITFKTFLENRPYYALDPARFSATNPNIVSIPISDYINNPITIVAIARKELLSSPAIRDFINTLLLQLGEHTI